MGVATGGLGVSKPALSRHLKVLEEGGVVVRVVEGRTRRLRLDVDPLEEAQTWLARQRAAWEHPVRRGRGVAGGAGMSDRVRIERTFGAPAQAVFDAWTWVEVLRRWWPAGPGWATPRAEVDLRVGGAVRSAAPGGAVAAPAVAGRAAHRDRDRRPAEQVADDLGISLAQQRRILNRARAAVRDEVAGRHESRRGPMNAVTPRRTLGRRLLPLQAAIACKIHLWVAVEKLFMSEIGFTAASTGDGRRVRRGRADAGGASGILADRWSRHGVLGGQRRARGEPLLGGLSHRVPSYVVAAMVLGVYFAFSSGTVDSIVYDTVLEETGIGAEYEKSIGRVRIVERPRWWPVRCSVACWPAGLGPLHLLRHRAFGLFSVVAFLVFDEPRLHRRSERTRCGSTSA